MARFCQGPARPASVIRKRRDFGMAEGRRIANQANRSRSAGPLRTPDRPGSHTKGDMAPLDYAIGVRCHSAICLPCLNQTGGTTCFDDFVWHSNCACAPPLLKMILPGWRWWRRRLEWGRYFQCNGWRRAPVFPSRSSRFSSGCKAAGWCLGGLNRHLPRLLRARHAAPYREPSGDEPPYPLERDHN
jgi:hypothetical protein